MQTNDTVLKRKLLFNGEEIPGLVETSELMDEEGIIEVPGFSRTSEVKNGIKKFAPLDCTYKHTSGSKVKGFFYDFYNKNQIKDVTVINTDATGKELDRWLLRDCECAKFGERAYNAGGVEFYGITVKLTCSSTPVRQDAN